MLSQEISEILQHDPHQDCPQVCGKLRSSELNHFIWRFINNDGRNFVDRFQPEIARNIEPILLNYFNK